MPKTGYHKFKPPYPAPVGCKWCSKCVTIKTIGEFYPSTRHKNSRHPWCSVCYLSLGRARYRTNIESNRRKARERAKRCPDTLRDIKYRMAYGISLRQYNDMLTSQNGVCAICLRADSIKLAVDHDHASGLIRGLLCKNCNRMIGLSRDNPVVLLAAANYVSQETHAVA